MPLYIKSRTFKTHCPHLLLMYHSATGWYISYLSHCYDKIPNKSNWKEKKVTLVQSEGTVHHGEKAWWQDHEVRQRSRGIHSQTAKRWRRECIMLSDSSSLWLSLSSEPVFRVCVFPPLKHTQNVFLGDPNIQTSRQWRITLTTVVWKCYDLEVHLTLPKAELRCVDGIHEAENCPFLLLQHESSCRYITDAGCAKIWILYKVQASRHTSLSLIFLNWIEKSSKLARHGDVYLWSQTLGSWGQTGIHSKTLVLSQTNQQKGKKHSSF